MQASLSFKEIKQANFLFSFNGQEKTDEIYGEGNLNTAEFWEYDTRLGRRWNIDPVVKPWESGYATFGNNPIWYSDLLGLDVKNAHKADRDKAQSNLDAAKEKFSGIKKGDVGYKSAKKELETAKELFSNIDAKFQRVEAKIKEIKTKDIDLFNEADKLTDAGGTKVDIYVYDTPEDVMQIGVKEGTVKFGDTDAQPGEQILNADVNIPEYRAVMSNMNGKNTVTIRVSDISKTIHLAHEFGHAIFQVKNMKQYLEWLQANPTQQNKGGHGKGDPSGEAAHKAEKNFK
jgi:hypothetical protein